MTKEHRTQNPHRKTCLICKSCGNRNNRELTRDQLHAIPAFTCDGCDKTQPLLLNYLIIIN